MSLHPSLKESEKDKKQRSVLKRSERLRSMIDKGEWKEGMSVFGLPKIKAIKMIKIKKEKAEKTETTAAAAPGTEAKEAAPKAPAAKPAAKTERK